MEIILIILAVLNVAAISACIVLASRSSANRQQETLKHQVEEVIGRISEISSRIEAAGIEERRVASEERRMAAEERRSSAIEFRAATQDALRESAESLRNSNVREINAILTPLRDQLNDFRRAVSDSYVNENASRQSLSDQIDRLMKLNVSIGEEARNLTDALKGNSKVQGDWGEMILTTLLENAGMRKDVNFFTQVTTDSSGKTLRDEETGRSLRPDVVISLPDEHKIVVDSKVSLNAFVDYHKAEDKGVRQDAARRHVASVKRHVQELSEKRYQNVVEGAAEHVLMFIPNEGAFMLAHTLDSGLWKYAYDRNVVITSPTHLFSILQIVSQFWRQENQNRNAEEIARQGGVLYDKFVKFMDTFETLEKNIERAGKSCEEARRQLSDSNQSLVAKAERLRSLGAKNKRRLSPADLRDPQLYDIPE